MLQLERGNLIDADVEALVNTVNCVGIMGKGIALQFKRAFPENFEHYKQACKRGDIEIGRVFITERRGLGNPRYILNFPTKEHWRGRSRIDWIRAGLDDLIRVIKENRIKSVAIPPLGCGNGGLDWDDVRPLILDALSEVPEVRAIVFEPGESPAATEMRVRSQRPRMTPVRAVIIIAIGRYLKPGYEATRLELQKLVYFLVRGGVSLPRVEYQKHKYGPYTPMLDHILEDLEGHFIRGLGDRKVTARITLLPGATEEAENFLTSPHGGMSHAHEAVDRVSKLIVGFETPFDMELLASVEWVAMQEGASDLAEVVSKVRNWNRRKADLFTERHVRIAWDRLREQDWISEQV